MLFSVHSFSAIEFAFLGNTTFSTPRIITGATNQSSTGVPFLGFGGMFRFTIIPEGKRVIFLELGGEFIKPAFNSSFSGSSTTYVFPFLKIPVNVSVGISKYFFATVGIYTAFLISNIDTITTAGSVTTIVSNSPNTLGYDGFDFGFNGGLGVQVPIGPKASLLFRTDYSIGIPNLDRTNGEVLQLFYLTGKVALSFKLK